MKTTRRTSSTSGPAQRGEISRRAAGQGAKVPRPKRSGGESLTASQQDYVEAVYRLLNSERQSKEDQSIRITDIAATLGTRLPTVTRTVARLASRGLFVHESRRGVRLTARGTLLARAFVHRHDDLVRFFVTVLGLEREKAERDTCQIEHGLSEISAQRLHEFLEYLDRLPLESKEIFFRFAARPAKSERPFEALPDQKVSGWRG